MRRDRAQPTPPPCGLRSIPSRRSLVLPGPAVTRFPLIQAEFSVRGSGHPFNSSFGKSNNNTRVGPPRPHLRLGACPQPEKATLPAGYTDEAVATLAPPATPDAGKVPVATHPVGASALTALGSSIGAGTSRRRVNRSSRATDHRPTPGLDAAVQAGPAGPAGPSEPTAVGRAHGVGSPASRRRDRGVFALSSMPGPTGGRRHCSGRQQERDHHDRDVRAASGARASSQPAWRGGSDGDTRPVENPHWRVRCWQAHASRAIRRQMTNTSRKPARITPTTMIAQFGSPRGSRLSACPQSGQSSAWS